ncbi:hypothetical protein HDK90DRAFT_114955 [Phyllosticta capitalensis]|uniref:Secreted protein n=1 Tax=Phyllosticta capitalensis TaxID=121624 RepID=A0ABR1YBC8_9PEZI
MLPMNRYWPYSSLLLSVLTCPLPSYAKRLVHSVAGVADVAVHGLRAGGAVSRFVSPIFCVTTIHSILEKLIGRSWTTQCSRSVLRATWQSWGHCTTLLHKRTALRIKFCSFKIYEHHSFT